MNYKLLEEYVCLASTESFSKAAKMLNVSPATLNARITALEKELDQKLFTREKKRIHLNKAGALFLIDAQDILQEYHSSLQRIHDFQEGGLNRLRIAVSGQGMPPRIESALIALCSRFPDLRPSIADDTKYSIVDSLINDKTDIYFAYADRSFTNENIRRIHLYNTQMCVIMSPQHRLAHRSTISLQELDGETFFLYPKTAEPSIHNLELKMLNSGNIAYSIQASSCSPALYQTMVITGLGIAFCPWVLRDHIPHDAVIVPLTNASCSCDMYMFYSRANQSPLVHTFINMIKKYIF